MSSFAYYLSSPLIYEFNYPSFPSITGPHKSCFHSHLYPSSIPMAPPCFTVHAPTGKKATCKLIDGVVSLLVRKHREHVTLKVFCYLYALIQVSFNQIQSLVSIQISDLEGLKYWYSHQTKTLNLLPFHFTFHEK